MIAGLPKCGTVWLVDALKSDERFQYVKNPFFMDKGEIRFFSRNFNQPIKNYFQAFQKKDTNQLTFEKSPDYSVMPTSRMRLIKKLHPKIKIILLFRDPVDRLFSNAKMDLIRVKGLELVTENDNEFFKAYKSQAHIYNYKAIVRNWSDVFSSHQILILSLEDIKLTPELVLKKVYEFLEVPYFGTITDISEARNTTKASGIPDHHAEFIRGLLGETLNYWNKNKGLFRIAK